MISTLSKTATAFLMLSLAAACGPSKPGDATDGGNTAGSTAGNTAGNTAGSTAGNSSGGNGATGGGDATPSVLSNTPLDGATSVALNASVSATFSEAMDPTTLTPSTFTLTSGTPAVPVAGTVIYANSKAVFVPTAQLPSDSSLTATITTGAKGAGGAPLAASHLWTFATGSSVAAGVPVDLGSAGQYVVLAKEGISTVTPSAITGDLGVSPYAASSITGFSLTADRSNVFSTSLQVTGKIYAADYAVPTPVNLATAVDDMQTAFTAAAGRAPDLTELGAGNIGGMNLPAGVYSWSTGLLIPTNVTLTGSGTDVWIFQIAQTLTVSNGAQVVLAGGALPSNVFWQVSGGASLGTTVQFEGTILGMTLISLNTGASITGRLLAQTAVTLSSSNIVAP